MESNQPLLNRREAVELLRKPMLAPNIHIINQTGLWQFSFIQTNAAFAAHIGLSIII
jgi:hypothetical protein